MRRVNDIKFTKQWPCFLFRMTCRHYCDWRWVGECASMAMHRDEYYNSKTAVILQAVRNSLFVLTLTGGKKGQGKRKRHERWEEQGRWREEYFELFIFKYFESKVEGSFLKRALWRQSWIPKALTEQYSSDCVCS